MASIRATILQASKEMTMQQIFAVLGYMSALLAFAIGAGLIARCFGWDAELNKWIHPTRQFNGWRKFWSE
ncbi:hypothetical protein C7I84_21630 [Mesorhizobium ephedrae]|uniref:Uncharacterized protein n=2 Tax=Kumtagia ephedrae TaxID=2116701 RepID=A0A2P7S128_9HYPH|nr:hypothetical protein C7I84_21630 [Mesorhizobium ephedrae]